MLKNSPKRVTINDVAREAGVSIATVSYVINGTKQINKETIEKVHQAVEQLNYQPSVAARSLMTKSTQIIGVLISDISNPFFAPIVRGIEDIASRAGYVVMIGNSDEEFDKARQYVNVLTRHGIDGLIISPTSCFKEQGETLNSLNIPIVLVNRRANGIDADIVETDNETGAYLAVRHLCSLGHTRIGLVIGPVEVSTYADRLKGYKRALDEAGIPVMDDLIRISKNDFKSGYYTTRELINSSNRPSSILIGSGLLARDGFFAVKELKITVPGELSLIVFDETEWAALVTPPLTTVAQSTYEMGQIAAALLLKKLGKKVETQSQAEWSKQITDVESHNMCHIKLKPKLILRDSTAPVGQE